MQKLFWVSIFLHTNYPCHGIKHSKNTRVSVTRKRSIGAKLHSGSKTTRKLVSFLQTWQIMGSDWPSSGSHSVSSWLISGSSLTRNGVWPISDPGVFRVKILKYNTRPVVNTIMFSAYVLLLFWMNFRVISKL